MADGTASFQPLLFIILSTQALKEFLCCVHTQTSQVYYSDRSNHVCSKSLPYHTTSTNVAQSSQAAERVFNTGTINSSK